MIQLSTPSYFPNIVEGFSAAKQKFQTLQPQMSPVPPVPRLQFGFQPRQPVQALVMLDMDDTFFQKLPNDDPKSAKFNTGALTRTVDQLNRSPVPMHVWLNTGRSTHELKDLFQKHPELNTPLKNFKLDGLVAEYGRRIFLNQGGLPILPWVSGLSNRNQSRLYLKEVQNAGWPNNETILKTIRDALKQAGYKRTSAVLFPRDIKSQSPTYAKFLDSNTSKPTWERSRAVIFLLADQVSLRFTIYPPQCSNDRYGSWRINSTPEHSERADDEFKRLTGLMQQSFTDKNVRAEIRRTTSKYTSRNEAPNSWYQVFFFPKGVNKATAAQWVLDHTIKDTYHIITVGDSELTDVELLTAEYAQKDGPGRSHALKRHAIACNLPDRPVSKLWDWMDEARASYTQATSGELDKPLKTIYQQFNRSD